MYCLVGCCLAHLLVVSKVRSRTPHLEAGAACAAAVERPRSDLPVSRHPKLTVVSGQGVLGPSAISSPVSLSDSHTVDLVRRRVIWRVKRRKD